MMKDLIWFGIRRAIYSISVIALFTATPLYAPAQDKKPGEILKSGPASTPAAPSQAAVGCPGCKYIEGQIGLTRSAKAGEEARLKSLDESWKALEEKWKKKRAELDELIELRSAASKDKELEKYIDDKEYIKKERSFNDELNKINREMEDNVTDTEKTRAEIKRFSAKLVELEGCKEKCQEEEKSHLKKVLEPPGSYIIDKTPPKTPCPSAPFKPVTIGSQEKFGASGKAKEVAKSVFGGLVGGLFGGGGGGGGGPSGMGETADKPPLDTNPFINQMSTFTDPSTGTAIAVAGKETEKGFLLGAAIDKGEGKPTIHSITLHRDDDCTMMLPERYFLYELWANWWVSVSWTKTTYVNNQVVKRESGGWFASGSVPVGLFSVNQAGEGSVWQYFGFDKATGGPKTVGAEFLNPATGGPVKFPDKAVVHITRPDQNPVTTVPFIFKVSRKTDGKLGFDHLLPPAVSPKILKPDV